MADYGDVSGGDSDAAVRAIVAQLQGVPSQAAANPSDPVPVATMPAPGVTPAMTWGMPMSAPAPAVSSYAPVAAAAQPAPVVDPVAPSLSPALMGALVAPRPAKPTMGTVYAPQPMIANTQGLAAIAQGALNGLDARDDLKKQDALQDAIQDATEDPGQ